MAIFRFEFLAASQAFQSTLRVTYITIASTINSAIAAHEQRVVLLTQRDDDHWNFSPDEEFLRQRVEPIQQIFFARDSGDLIAQLAVLEKKKSRDGANVTSTRGSDFRPRSLSLL